jgi:hypothetical protein
MGMITSIRAPLPVAEAQVPLASATPRASGFGVAAPVADTTLAGAVQQTNVSAGTREAQLMALRMTADASATRAAEAARDAYIKASIAAGINPLPLS